MLRTSSLTFPLISPTVATPAESYPLFFNTVKPSIKKSLAVKPVERF